MAMRVQADTALGEWGLGATSDAGRAGDAVKTIKDFTVYFSRLVRDGVFIAVTFVDATTFLVKSFVPSTRRPPILDESWAYLVVLAFGFVIAAYRLDRDLRARLSTERSALREELKERLIRLKFTIERRNKEPIPMDQVLGIEGLAKDLKDGYVIAGCGEIKSILQRNYESRYYVVYLFEDARKDYDSVRAKVDHALNHLEKTVGPVMSGSPRV